MIKKFISRIPIKHTTKRTAAKLCFLSILIPLILIGCATQKQCSIPFYEHHEQAPLLKEAVEKLQTTHSDIPALAEKRIMVRVYKDKSPNALVHHDNRNIHVHIADSLLTHLTREDLLCVLAHECAHVEYNHSAKQQTLARTVSLTIGIANALFPNYGIGLLNTLANPLIVNSYSRHEEMQADTRALNYLSSLGISYNDYIHFLNLADSITDTSRKGGGLFDTHPHFEQRIENAKSIGSTLTVTTLPINVSSRYRKFEQMLRRKTKINREYPFAIGPYGEAKAVQLIAGLTEKELRTIFDGYKPDRKKRYTGSDKSHIYTIPATDFSFVLFLHRDGKNPYTLTDFTIVKHDQIDTLENPSAGKTK